MGPEATADIYLRIIKLYQKQFGAKFDSDYPRILVDSIPIPNTIENFENRDQTLSILSQSAKNLESSGADFIIVTCNTVFSLLPYVEKEISIPIINIIEEVKKRVLEKCNRKVGLLSTFNTIKSGIYGRLFENSGIEIIYPDQKSQSKINEIILNIMSGMKLEKDRNEIVKIIKELISAGSESIILGCTELPLLVKNSNDIDTINTNQIIAEVAVELSLKNGQGSVKASIEVCGTSGSGSIPTLALRKKRTDESDNDVLSTK